MSRRDVRLEVAAYPPPPPSKCAKVLYYTWKLCSLVFSHFVMISLVVAYCILGAVTFERLEADYEKEVKRNISNIRTNTTQSIWVMTRSALLLNHTNWTSEVVDMLKDFENAILLEMKVRGWDGNENADHIQWTFTGALFYSIVVITTIGYGHITPKTQTGKVVTIFYAIVGIPLMLLCLSNIGDVMASSFRFLYWRVCCYVCTRPPKRRHHTRASARRSVRASSTRGSTRRRKPLERSHSDTDCRYRDSGYSSHRTRRPRTLPRTLPCPASQPPVHTRAYGIRDYDIEDHSPVHYNKYQRHVPEADEEPFPKISLPLQNLAAALKDLDNYQTKKTELRSKSLPRPAKNKPDFGARRDYYDDGRLYEVDGNGFEAHDLHDVDYENYREKKALEERDRRRRDMIEDFGYKDRGYDPEDDDYEFDNPRGRKPRYKRRAGRSRSEYYERNCDEFVSEPRDRRARSAAVHGERRACGERGGCRERATSEERAARGRRRLRRLDTVDDSIEVPPASYRYTPSPEPDDWSDEGPPVRRSRPPPAWGSRPIEIHPVAIEVPKHEIKPVPIWLCVFLVASYIVAGTFIFKQWEGWEYLDAAYFCFITLTAIGFGDFVPAQGQTGAGERDAAGAVHSIALCSLYLLFGMALLAMSFNLVQEEVRANVAALATKLGIIKPAHADQYSDSE